MSDPLSMSEGPVEQKQTHVGQPQVGGDQWLGGEAFLGSDFRPSDGRPTPKIWTQTEVFAVVLGALTLGAALGLVFGRSSK